jgi:hypothetical protein
MTFDRVRDLEIGSLGSRMTTAKLPWR